MYAFDVGGAGLVGVAAIVRVAPGALASPFAGLMGDRHSRRKLLAFSSFTSAVAIGIAAWAVGADAPAGVVIALAGVFTVTSSIYIPAEGRC